jgi:tRNA1Val (adenine37-N6)-methyltransferase
MANNYFTFKQFTIRQDRCAMKVGTDGVLLGAWVNVKNADRILDVGTGTGLIAIMMAQRSAATIDAVEIDDQAFRQATENIASCPWKDRINIYNASFQHFAAINTIRYDRVVSNPPYFRNSLKPPVKSRSMARHDETFSYEGLLYHAARISTPEGRLAVIVPADEMDFLTYSASFQGLYLSRLLRVRPVAGKPYSRCLAEFTHKQTDVLQEDELTIREKGSSGFTARYKALTKEYYPNF